ncbi:zinc finger CCCH domain-containing protein 11A isoform X2 [Scleropages formosus]|nr:zinc finger CCCH domain-containing protein 11A isoform X2 [Scleropages formosus]
MCVNKLCVYSTSDGEKRVLPVISGTPRSTSQKCLQKTGVCSAAPETPVPLQKTVFRNRILSVCQEFRKAVVCTSLSMTNHGDDCYFYYYSTCTKGDSCPFRHCEAAMGSEIVCNLWEESRCFRKICKFRHMEIKKKRSEIPCYWENQPAGCQKPHCAFHHEKPRFIDGIYVPPSKVSILKKEVEEEAHQVEPPPPAPAPVSNPANPQLRGVIKAETLENVPSPTHPPVVISTVDDEDEDEDDQLSEGEEIKLGSDATRIVSPRKLIPGTNQDDSLNFGIKTLEEIRLRKTLKANLKKIGQSSSQSSNTTVEKENMRSSSKACFFTDKEETPLLPEEPVKRRIGDRLGKRRVSRAADKQIIVNKDDAVNIDVPLKRRLAERLGRKLTVSEDDADTPKVLKSVRERLELSVEPSASETENCGDAKSPGEIRIKTLEEIRQEKAARSQGQAKDANVEVASTKAPSSTKRAAKILPSPPLRTFSEVLHAKKKEKEQRSTKEPEAATSEKSKTMRNMGTQGKMPTQPGEVRVKTLEEIRKEKAERMQAKGEEVRTEKSYSTGDELPKKRMLRIRKAVAPGAFSVSDKTAEAKERSSDPVDTETSAASVKVHSSEENRIKVKTFEEIMREKRLRMQQQELSSVQCDEPSPATTPKPALVPKKEQSLSKVRQRGSIASPSEPISAPKISLSGAHQHVALQQEDGFSVSDARQEEAISLSVEKVETGSSTSVRKDCCLPLKQKVCLAPPPVPQAAPNLTSKEPHDVVLKTSPGQVAEHKVRPKLNVKPSVMKPAAPVKLCQKRKAVETQRSAIAEVKPLNSVPTAVEDQPKDVLRMHSEVLVPSEGPENDVQGRFWAPKPPVVEFLQNISNIEMEPESSSSAQPDGASLAEQSRVTVNSALLPASEPHAVPHSSVMAPKQPSQGKARRLSSVSARAGGAPEDDFDELISEFTDDRIEDEMELDPCKGGDDLLLELSEMIGN